MQNAQTRHSTDTVTGVHECLDGRFILLFLCKTIQKESTYLFLLPEMTPQFNLEAFFKLFLHAKVKQPLLDSARDNLSSLLIWLQPYRMAK